MGVSDRLAELGIVLPDVVPPVASYVPAVRTGNLVMTSGQLPMSDGALASTGKVGDGVDLVPPADAAGLARLLHVGAPAILVLFGTFCPGEMIVETVRGRPRNTLRRMARGDVPARLGGHDFTVRYHRAADLERAMAPWFEPRGRQGVGLFVPPSAAEPWISRHPKLLAAFERLDRALPPALALFGDHILYRVVRTDVAADAA